MFEYLNSLATDLTLQSYIIIIISALIGGLILALSSKYKENYSASFLNTVFLLPPVVAIVILMVNGNLGTGIAVAGAFSLVRFRSAPGTAKEITVIFLAMALGLILGMGHVVYGFVFLIILLLANFTYKMFESTEGKILKITIPEDLEFKDIFDDIFKNYLTNYKLVNVKTTNMGSLFKLTYHVTLKENMDEKSLIDELRVKNGNLEISCLLKDSEQL